MKTQHVKAGGIQVVSVGKIQINVFLIKTVAVKDTVIHHVKDMGTPTVLRKIGGEVV